MFLLGSRGDIDMCAPVANYLPVFNNDKSRQITVAQIVRHSSGFPEDYAQDRGEYDAVEDAIEEIALAGPGSELQASSINYDVMLELIQAVSGKTISQFFSEELFSPLGMNNTIVDVGENPEVLEHLLPQTIHYENAEEMNVAWRPGDPPTLVMRWQSSSAFSNITDYAAFLSFWLGDGSFNGQQIIANLEQWIMATRSKEDSECVFTGLDEEPYDVAERAPRWLATVQGPTILAMPKYKLMGLLFTQYPWNNSNNEFWQKVFGLQSELNWQQ